MLLQARNILTERMFSDSQVDKIFKRLPSQILEQPKYLADTIDTWNDLMDKPFGKMPKDIPLTEVDIPKVATPPKGSALSARHLNINTILADVEPDLLLFEPIKLRNRHKNILGLGLINSQHDLWTLLFNAPRGFFLQDWAELVKKIYYIEHYVIDLIYDKREQKTIISHPLIKSAAATEVDFDHIRARYLFASRSGYLGLAHMYKVQTAADRPSLHDVLLSDNHTFLSKFSPFCSEEEYSAFSNLIKNYSVDEDDALIFSSLADLNATSHVQR